MLFNSYEFLFVFLPIALAGFFLLGAKGHTRSASAWLAVASLAFYGHWNPHHVPLIIASIAINYWVGERITRTRSRPLLWLGVVGNLVLLGVCKYRGFAVENINLLFGTHWPVPAQVLPLGVSFFTFTQIAFLVDAYRGSAQHYPGVRYGLFVLFFPHLIAGPIVHHHQLIPQLGQRDIFRFQSTPFAVGLTLFILGLAKKVIFADPLATFVRPVFAAASDAPPELVTAWIAALGYTLQLYFDFSGYSDMALGLARMFNVKFPANFNSPYKAGSIIEFWRRWHITLSAFLRDYLYIPLGGSRCGTARHYLNLFLTMLIGGIWHGAGWTFVIWGAWHGALLCINHVWRTAVGPASSTAGRFAAGALTFLCVIVGWVFFRAGNVATALHVLRGMVDIGTFSPGDLAASARALAWIVPLLALAWFAPNTQQLLALHEPALGETKPTARAWSPTPRWAIAIALIFVLSVVNLSRISEFIYFQF